MQMEFRLPRRGNALLLVLLLLLVIGLAVLATLQYRWIDSVTNAERNEKRANIDFAARRFADDVKTEMNQLFDAFADPNRGDIAQRYDEWSRAASHPNLLAAVYTAERSEEAWTLRMFDPARQDFMELPWPRSLEKLRREIEEAADRPRRQWPPPFLGDVPAFFIPPRPMRDRAPDGPPMFDMTPPPGPRITIVMINRGELTKTMLPSLADRYFSTAKKGEYDLALISGPDVLFRSDASWPDGRIAADYELPFIAIDRKARPPFAPPPPPMQPWRLLVRRHDGSVDALVSSTRTRNLAISFGILFILGATALFLVALLRRANRLRAQQTQFVAAMSHELNTPIAALRSAGENLKDGIVAEREQLARYGETIVKESARLGDMVGQVLEFAGMQARATRPALLPVDVAGVIETAVAQCQWILSGTKIDVEVKIDDDLPAVRGDTQALTRAVQNLIANAIRHGGSGQWVGVRASREGGGVTITVEDHGPGIDGREASRLFEPFYRGQKSSSVRGAGLGLAIVRQIAIAHGGSVEIDRRKRGGAAFAFHLPAAVEHA